jgi:putative heme transporter
LTALSQSQRRAGVLIALLLAGLWAIYHLSHVLIPFFVALSLVYLLNPWVSYLSLRPVSKGQRLGRPLAIAIIYTLLIAVVWFSLSVVVPQLSGEITRLIEVLPEQLKLFQQQWLPNFINNTQHKLDAAHIHFNVENVLNKGLHSWIDNFQDQLGELAKKTRDIIAGFFNVLITSILVFMITTFTLLDWPKFRLWCILLIPEDYRQELRQLVKAMDKGLSGAVRGQLGVCVLNGVLTSLGLLVLKVKFAISLGVMAGLFSFIPVFGTLISTIPAAIVGLIQSPWTALAVIAWILLIHLLEANVFNPKIIGHNAELHPVLVVLSLVLGEHLGGPAGLLIAVPIATVVRAVIAFTLGRFLFDSAHVDGPIENWNA